MSWPPGAEQPKSHHRLTTTPQGILDNERPSPGTLVVERLYDPVAPPTIRCTAIDSRCVDVGDDVIILIQTTKR